MRLGRLAFHAAALIGAGLPMPEIAEAGAWTRAKGDGVIIASTGRRVAPAGSIAGGPIDDDSNFTQIYLEYGLIDGLTIGAKTFVELSSIDPTEGSAAAGAFLRKRVWQGDSGGIASVELGYAHPIERMLGNRFAAVEGAVPEAHLAGLYGHGWAGDWGNAFVSTGAAFFLRQEGAAEDLRLELTGGYSPSKRVMGILGLYGLAPLGSGTDPSLRVAPSVAFTFWPKLDDGEAEGTHRPKPKTLQLGFSFDLLNRDDGLGISLSVWNPF
ncbi:MAG: hypothetical protein OEN23_17100 [Paracoccaceae bacterium]|nr:hypothetical protein [Paracoccaceae bacterium]